MTRDEKGEEVVRPEPGAASLLEEVARRGSLSRRALVQRALVLGLASPGIVRATSRPAAAGSVQTGQKGGDGTLVVTTSGDPLSFNPDFQLDDNGFLPCANIYSTLLSLDVNFNIIPELAELWAIAEDGLSVTFTLVEGATWHDGAPVTSADVKYTFEQIVANASAPAAGLIGAIASVDTPDARTAVCRLKQPSASIVGFIAWYGTFILPAHVYDGSDWATNPANQAPIGSGPFKFVGYDPGSSIELAANLDFWGEGPYVDRLIFRIVPDPGTALQALRNGEVDLMISPSPPNSEVPALEQTAGLKVIQVQYPSVHYIGFHLEKEPMSKLEVRKAIAQAIDRQQILDLALGSYGGIATTFYTSAIAWATNTDPDARAPEFDKAAAAAALDAAGYPVRGGARFKLDLLYSTSFGPEYGDIATVLKQQLAAVNIDVELVGLEVGAFVERGEAGDFDIELIDGAQGPDPANLRLRIGTGGALNHGRYSNPAVEALLNEGDAATDQAARADIYHQIQAILARDLPIVPLTDVVVNYPHSDRVAGLFFDDTDPVASRVGLYRFTLTRIAE